MLEHCRRNATCLLLALLGLAVLPAAYAGPPRWYRGSLHNHTTWSDGSQTPQELCTGYKNLGYDFVVISDHQVVTPVADLSSPGFLVLSGEEITLTKHVVGIGLLSTISPAGLTPQTAIDTVNSLKGIPVFAHPRWSGTFTALRDIPQWHGFRHLEICNANSESQGDHDDGSIWDTLLTAGRTVWGLACDDTHLPIHMGKAWVCVRAAELSADSIFAAIDRGDLYCSTGVQIDSVSFDGLTYTVTATAADSIVFRGAHRRILSRVPGNVGTYAPDGSELYVRAEVFGPGGARAWTQPQVIPVVIPTLVGTVPLKAGWNLIGIPLNAPDMTVKGLFPSVRGKAFRWRWDGAYSADSVLSVGQGYWLRSDSAGTIPVTGTALAGGTIPLIGGWNLIGALDTPADASSAVTAPADILCTAFYGFRDTYVKTSILEPGYAYWVKASQAGSLSFRFASLDKAPDPPGRLPEDWITLEFRDSLQHPVVLALAPAQMPDRAAHELPPAPPDGVFDVRYASGAAVQTFVQGVGQYPMHLASVRWPLSVTVRNSHGYTLVLHDDLLNTSTALEEGKRVTIAMGADELLLEVKATVPPDAPVASALLQCYPNPFNPETTVKFSVRRTSPARLTIFSLLGQEIATLFDGTAEKGRFYQVKFNGQGLATGVYICRLTAGADRTSTRLMLAR